MASEIGNCSLWLKIVSSVIIFMLTETWSDSSLHDPPVTCYTGYLCLVEFFLLWSCCGLFLSIHAIYLTPSLIRMHLNMWISNSLAFIMIMKVIGLLFVSLQHWWRYCFRIKCPHVHLFFISVGKHVNLHLWCCCHCCDCNYCNYVCALSLFLSTLYW